MFKRQNSPLTCKYGDYPSGQNLECVSQTNHTEVWVMTWRWCCTLWAALFHKWTKMCKKNMVEINVFTHFSYRHLTQITFFSLLSLKCIYLCWKSWEERKVCLSCDECHIFEKWILNQRSQSNVKVVSMHQKSSFQEAETPKSVVTWTNCLPTFFAHYTWSNEISFTHFIRIIFQYHNELEKTFNNQHHFHFT